MSGLQCTLLAGLILLAACDVQISDAPDEAAPGEVSSADYRRAEQFLAPNTEPLVSGNIMAQHWQTGDRLLYQRSAGAHSEFVLVDASAGSQSLLFDSRQLAEALNGLEPESADPLDLAIDEPILAEDGGSLEFAIGDRRYRLDLAGLSLTALAPVSDAEFLSPDRRWAAYIDSHNLWVRNLETDERLQLTEDGAEHYGYGTNNAGWLRDDRPVLKWSPDSSKIATFRHDGREVGEMYLYTTQVGHPELDAWKYPLPGDEHIFMIERVILHVEPEPRLVRLQMPPDPHRSTTSDHVADSDGTFLDVQWSEDSTELAFVSSSRDHKRATLRVADADNGAVRDLFTETVDTYFESGLNAENWRVLFDRDQFLWFSERNDWGHLYLYDSGSGELLHPVTEGDWSVLSIERLDRDREQIYFMGANREEGNPYYRYLYRVNLDGSGLTRLTPELAHHQIAWSDSGDYFSDRYSSPAEPGAAVLRDRDGEELMLLEQTDISELLAAGWVPPEPFTVKARDGQTDLYGLLYRPSDFDPDASYPVLNYLYPGPQSGSVGSRAFSASRRDKQAIAELGFIVVEVDAMGTPGRSKSFHDAYYGNMGDNGLPDQIAAIRQLAERNPAMDLDRVGIWGHSGGGFASTAGILRYPDFYKVAVSGAGNHDNRNYEDDWAEKWQGLLEVTGEAEGETLTNYDNQANQLLADRLEGKLLLAHGMLDDNVHPSNTLLVVQALIEAEKDFDLLVLPEARHGFGNRRYFMKRRWDYFVRHLHNQEPPADFRFADNIP